MLSFSQGRVHLLTRTEGVFAELAGLRFLLVGSGCLPLPKNTAAAAAAAAAMQDQVSLHRVGWRGL